MVPQYSVCPFFHDLTSAFSLSILAFLFFWQGAELGLDHLLCWFLRFYGLDVNSELRVAVLVCAGILGTIHAAEERSALAGRWRQPLMAQLVAEWRRQSAAIIVKFDYAAPWVDVPAV